VEKNIHQKRHLFPNPLLQHYPANLRRQGNAPAESNHSSIVRRLGPSFYDSPVSLIGALLQRHADISAERHNFLQTYHLRVCTNTPRLPDGSEKEALRSLTSWGMKLFRSSIEDSLSIDMNMSSNGKCSFVNNNQPSVVLIKLEQNATACYCTFWKAYHLQCSHLLLLHKGFSVALCSPRWVQLEYLESSDGDSKGKIQSNDLGGNLFDPFDDQIVEVGRLATVASQGDRTVTYRDILDATDELVKSVSNVSNLSVKQQHLGEIIRLAEIVKGDLKIVEGMPVQYLLDGQFSAYNQSSAGQQISAQDASLTVKCTMRDDQGKDVDVAIGPLTMKRAAPQPTHNHSKKRKKSKEEIK
jgi:hypothetical protein